MSLRFLFLDFNSFFASVEQALRPELRGRPVAVIPVKAETTSCIAASYEAKRFGVKTGTPVYEARQLCPGIEIIEARPREYIDYHKRLHAVIDAHLPVETIHSIDEMHCPLWGRWREPAPAVELAREIKDLIAREVSPHLTCSIGLAPNVFLAKTASDMQKPDGLTVICPEDLPGCLHRLELRDLCGIGANMETRLRRADICTVEALCAASKETLRAVWGSVEGAYFHAKLRGEITERTVERRRSLGHSHVLPPELRNEEGAHAVLHRLTQKAAARLRSIGHLAQRMSWFVRGAGSERGWTDEISFAATDDTEELLKTLNLLWRRRLPTRLPPAAVGVTFLELVSEDNHTPSLFGQDERRRRHALLETIDHINRTRGKNTVYYAGAQKAMEYTPLRIAFNRIPDLETEC